MIGLQKILVHAFCVGRCWCGDPLLGRKGTMWVLLEVGWATGSKEAARFLGKGFGEMLGNFPRRGIDDLPPRSFPKPAICSPRLKIRTLAGSLSEARNLERGT